MDYSPIYNVNIKEKIRLEYLNQNKTLKIEDRILKIRQMNNKIIIYKNDNKIEIGLVHTSIDQVAQPID